MTETVAEPMDDDLKDLGYRAEDLSETELQEWTVLTAREKSILSKLEGSGQRLLIGPRGSGKSTYLKLAYFGALEGSTVLPVYVNYSRSISLEPEFRRNASAIALFRQWLLAQIVAGLEPALNHLGHLSHLSQSDRTSVTLARAVVDSVERQRFADIPDSRFSISDTLEMLERIALVETRRRVVLLLDDAAHAFSSEQQREFFDLFAALKSRTVSAKAAVYPGVTSYTPRFHVGHDAQLIDVWLRPGETEYLPMMREVATRRLGTNVTGEFERRDGALDYLALGSFGLPRTFILMLTQVLEGASERTISFTKPLYDEAISSAADNALKVFDSLKDKLPRYRRFIEVGRELLDASIEAIREYNERRDETDSSKALTILLQRPLPPEIERILGFLEYSSLIRRGSSVSMGPDKYEVIFPHSALLLSRTALGLGRNPSIASGADVLSQRDPHARVRRQIESLLGRDYLDRCRLDLASCPNCGAERENPEARFCFHCGFRLEEASIYDELLSASVEKLPISPTLLRRISEHSDIREIKDILMDEERQTLLKIPYVGPVRATRIQNLAEEFVYE